MSKKLTKSEIVPLSPVPLTRYIKKLVKGTIQISIGTLNIFTTPVAPLLPSIKPLPATWRHEKTYRLNKKLLIFDIILSLVVLALIGSNIFLWLRKPSGPVVSLDFKIQPETIKSGGEINFSLNYINESKEVLKEANLTLGFPSYFILKQILPSNFNEKTNTIFLGNLSPGANGQIKVKGCVIGEIGESQKISAILSWKDESGRLKQDFFSQAFLIEDSHLRLSLDLPEKIFNDASFNLKIRIENNSLIDFDETEVMIDWPEGFEIIDSLVLPEDFLLTAGTDSIIPWKSGGWFLRAGEKKEIKITGLIFQQKPADQNEIKDKFKARLFIKKDNQNLLQNEKEKFFALVFPNFYLKQETKTNAFPGQDLEYLVTYQNRGKSNLQDLEIKIKLEGEFFDFKNIVAEGGEIRGNQVIWKVGDSSAEMIKEKNLSLATLMQKGQLKFKIKILPEIFIQESTDNQAVSESLPEGKILTTRLEASYKMVDDLRQTIKVRAEDLIVKVNSNLKLETDVRYYTPEGDQIGRGSWPPKAGEIAWVWIFLRITNTTNNIKDAVLVGSLVPGVLWADKISVSQGKGLVYDKKTHKFDWSIGEIPAHLGQAIPPFEAAFEVSFTPQIREEGITLVKDLNVVGKDAFTKDEVSCKITEVKLEKE